MRIPIRRALTLLLLAAPGLLAAEAEPYRTASLRPVERARARVVPGELVVKFREAAEPADEEAAIGAVGGRRARRSAFGDTYRVALDPGSDVAVAVRRLEARPEVEWAEPNGRVRAFYQPNDSLYCRQWHLKLVGAERTWDIQQGDPSVVVAVLDTGIAYEDHGPYRKAPDFSTTTFVPGYDFIEGDAHPNDDNFHGTHVASVIAEATGNGVGVAGLAFRVGLMPVKVLDFEGVGDNFAVAEGIRFATGSSRVKVINMSLGGETQSRVIAEAVNAAVAAGITVVAAAGNEEATSVSYPAALPNVIAVGAVDARKRRAPYSNRGSALDVVAPGGDLDRDDDGACSGGADGHPDGVLQQSFDPDTAYFEGRYDDFAYYFVSGTSQASPHVAALAALLYRQGVTEPAAVQALIEQTAEDLGPAGRDDEYGHGLVRPAEALRGLGLNR